MIHLGEREGSLLRHNQKLIEESPSPSFNDEQRQRLWAMALDIARLFHFQNAGAVEFLMDAAGNFHFTEMKARIQIEHGVSEMLTDVDIVREQSALPLANRWQDAGRHPHARLGHAVPDQRRRPME